MATESRCLQMEDGTAGTALLFEGEYLHLHCARAYPPGQPLNLTLHTDDGPLALSGRCIGSKRRAEGDYAIRMRMTNMRREVRSWLKEHLALLP